jgi:pimeloyl-ACP methyl ester carboxylesterase
MYKWSFADLKHFDLKKMRDFKVMWSNGEFYCNVYGSGRKKMIAFYGFGQSSEALFPLISELKDFTVYVVDLPFHGGTNITDESHPIENNQLHELLESLIETEHLHEFSLLAFSIGAKLALPLVTYKPQHIEKVVLIAPDGIRERIWYRLTTRNVIGRSLFRFLAKRFQQFDRLISLALKMNFIDVRTARFVKMSVSNEERMKQLYRTWCYLSTLKTNLANLVRKINEYKVQTVLVIGKEDRIILSDPIIDFASMISNCQLLELDAEHNNLIINYSREIKGMSGLQAIT